MGDTTRNKTCAIAIRHISEQSGSGDIGLNTLMTPQYMNLLLDVCLATFHLSPQILTPTLPCVTCGLMRTLWQIKDTTLTTPTTATTPTTPNVS